MSSSSSTPATTPPAAPNNSASSATLEPGRRTRRIEVFGVNPQNAQKHESFREKYHFPFPLLVDAGQKVGARYHTNGLIVKRTVYVIGPDGKIRFGKRGMPDARRSSGCMRVMRLPRVYPILDTESLDRRGIALETAAAAFLEGGAGILQIRHKAHWSRGIFDAAKQRRAHSAGKPAPLSSSTTAPISPCSSMPDSTSGRTIFRPAMPASLIGPDSVIGFSSHNAESALRRRRRARGLRRAGSHLRHRIQAQS